MKTTCFLCQASFECGATDPTNACWCSKKPLIAIAFDGVSCLCEACFDRRVQKVGSLSCFRLHISYVGTDFSGFQAQDNARTVEAELKKAIFAVTGQDVKVNVAGRTDAGVHARGQVVSIQLNTRLLPRQLTLALSANLPKDVSVWRIDQMPLGFDARRQSVGKRYVYRISQGLVADPFLAKNALHVRESLDVDAMATAAKYFEGEHDFSSFRGSLCNAAHAVRFIWQVGVKKLDSLIEIDVRGNAFCLNMVRIMVGTLIEVGKKKRVPEDVMRALLGKDRRLAGVTAKAHGLTLERVYYPDDLASADIPATATFPRFPVSDRSWGYRADEICYGPT